MCLQQQKIYFVINIVIAVVVLFCINFLNLQTASLFLLMSYKYSDKFPLKISR